MPVLCWLACRCITLHRFPNPKKYPETFADWLRVVGNVLKEKDTQRIYANKRICGHHFLPEHRTTGHRLIKGAKPTLHLNGVLKSMITITEAEHNYCFRVMPPNLPATSSTPIGPLHSFPKRISNVERFTSWKEVLRSDTKNCSDQYLYNQVRLCYRHFEDFYRSPNRQITRNAIPTLNLSQYDGVERTDAPKNQTDKDVPGPNKPPEPNLSNKTNVASKTDTSTAKIYGDLKADDDNLDSVDNEGFNACFDFTIEDVPPEPPKEFSWQETKATVDLADDGDDIQDDLSLYCSDDEEKPPVYEYPEDPAAHVGFHCNVCNKDIVGFRYVCVQCLDFDLCGGCEASGAHDQHYVLRIPGPRPHREVQTVLARIRKQLMASMDPIQVADDAMSIKSEVKEEDEQMLLQEVDTVRVREETENSNDKENQETSQDEGETSQDEADPLQTHNNSDAESSVDDSEAEWRPSKEDLADIERTENDFPSNIRRYTRKRLTNIKPSTKEMPPRSNIEQSDKQQQTFKNKTQLIKIKPLPTNVAQAKLRIIQSNTGANIIALPVSQADPKIIFNRINLDKLTKPIMGENTSLKKRRIIMSTSDFEKFLTMQQPAKKVFMAGVSGDIVNIATSHRQPSNVIYASSSKTNDNDTIR
ncbi:hypothetical protein K1T71_013272 [Dendrolimus kikuchii]|uniref:Uncharacterized protein n=1 Tax=Dendrolimus kikuchii TaxID=765133 RepID=A0ACC1CHR8_9NEOP|nr:hypothetical protein K1T71_013272 [Dendrolimus kikuchii]